MKKDQFIIAYIADLAHSETPVSYAIWFAKKIKPLPVILTHISDPRYKKSLPPNEAEPQLQHMQRELAAQHPDIQISYAALKGNTRSLITALPTLLGAVVVTAQVSTSASWRSPLHKRSVLKNFSQCRTAFLVAQEPLGDFSSINDVAATIDFKKESKDKIIWTSYFPRFGKCNMHILYYDYKDQFLKTKWYANMTQLHKLYNELGITFSPHIIPSKGTYMDVNALRYLAQNNLSPSASDEQAPPLFVAVTTKERDGLEFFIGTQEQRTIVNKHLIPILFLNPREDLYVLCD